MSHRNSSATVHGGAGGRGAKASVSTPEGLRNMLRNDRNRDPPVSRESAPRTSSAAPRNNSAAPSAPGDDKQILRGLNERLGNYMGRVKQLEEENKEVQKKIDDILAKRKAPERRDWKKIEEPLDDLEKQIKDLTVDNADLLMQIDLARLASEDFKNKKDDEIKAKKDLEKDLEKLKNNIDDIKTHRDQVLADVDLVKDDIDHLKQEHKDNVDDLLERIKESEVKVEVDSSNSNLADVINDIRAQYAKMAEKNLKEMEDWYKDKFDNIKVETDHNTEACESGKTERKDLLKEKKTLEIQINSGYNTLKTLEDTVRKIKIEYSQKTSPLYRLIVKLEAELKDLRDQVELQGEKNEKLLNVTMKLEREIKTYKDLLTESARFDLEDALQNAQQSPNPQNVPKGEEKANIPHEVVDDCPTKATPKK